MSDYYEDEDDDEDEDGEECPSGHFDPFFCHFTDPKNAASYLCGGKRDGSVQWSVHLSHQDVGPDARCTAGCGRFRCQSCLHEAIKRGYFPESARKHIYKGA